MKVTFYLDDGSELTVKQEQLQLFNDEKQNLIGLVYRIGQSILPLITFNGQLATPEEVKARTKTNGKIDEPAIPEVLPGPPQ